MNAAGHLPDPDRWQVTAPAALPVAALLIGRPVEEAAMLIGRVFNLCRAAQETALRLALGLPVGPALQAGLAAEIRREHAQRLGVILPALVGLPGLPAAHLLAAPTEVPAGVDDFEAFLGHATPLARLLTAIDARFPPGTAVTASLPAPTGSDATRAGAFENSVATRHLDHPAMRHVEASRGRGPLWRVLARVLGLSDAIPAPAQPRQGLAIVPAARGVYAVEASAEAGRLVGLVRRTPTDHLLAPGGILAQSLATLPSGSDPALLMAILDPCVPVIVREAAHA